MAMEWIESGPLSGTKGPWVARFAFVGGPIRNPRHLRPAMPDFESRTLCFRQLGRGNMLHYATFSGFFAIEKNSMFDINPNFDKVYVNYTHKHSF